MPNLKLIIGLIAIGALLLSGCAQQQLTPPSGNAVQNNSNPAPNGGGTAANQPELQIGNFTVEITNDGYKPNPLTIKKGSTVTWVNKTSTPNWPATAAHPTHTVYPGSSKEKCGTAEAATIFDACNGLEQGESYSFTFNEIGEWAYHEHLNVKMFGKIVVKE